ncbi:hypothetical protein [Spirosoma sp. KUDC1026]|uniref:hypothetical protein n=1 Tax=Spirosoma sp. KUDC1026 TaxID=2745947 RepID=UPI00159BB779|nr:hypothetical protein [Spirosoma sp. KUDC1026]QKZ15151.1 hypothetical protein HU175_22020 [Spirosoma sp. KUDC1026]
MKSTATQRIAEFNRIAAGLKTVLLLGEEVLLNRQELIEKHDLEPWLVNRTLMLLVIMGLIKQHRRGIYEATFALYKVTGEQLELANKSYDSENYKRKKERQNCLPEVPPSAEPKQGELTFITPQIADARPISLPCQIRKEAVYGYIIATQAVFYDTLEEAELEAQIQAVRHGLTEITLIQKLKEIEVPRPIVRTITPSS